MILVGAGKIVNRLSVVFATSYRGKMSKGQVDGHVVEPMVNNSQLVKEINGYLKKTHDGRSIRPFSRS